jgi:threonine/homoserine/homoserine lactone efflux protein
MSRVLPTRITLPVIFGIAFATGFSGAVTPGSLLAVVVRESVRLGWTAGPLMMIGHGALELIAVILLAAGLITFARAGAVRGVIGLVGGAVLIYLAYLTLGLSGETGARAMAATGEVGRSGNLPYGRGEWLRLAGLGMVASVVNPYWWLWWATIGVAHTGWATQRGRLGGGTYLVGHVLSDVVWFSAVSAALGAGRVFLSAGVLRGIYLASAIFLALLGVFFLISGYRAVRAGRHHRHPSLRSG